MRPLLVGLRAKPRPAPVSRPGPVRHRADAADALRQVGGVPGVAALEDVLEAPELGAGALRIGNLLHASYGIDGHFDLQVSFYPGYRINNRYGCHLWPPIVLAYFHGKSHTEERIRRC